MNNRNSHRMKEMPSSERPYEKCMEYGAGSLTDAELLAVILRSGTHGRSSVELSRDILRLSGRESGLTGLYGLSLEDLRKVKGIGKVKALQVQAIGELSKRLSRERAKKGLVLDRPDTIAEYYMEQLRHEEQERLICMMLDTKNHLLGQCELFRGTVNASLISPREIFLQAFRFHAVNLILIHNHPSGDPTPSKEDYCVTERVFQGGELLDIHLLDHIVIGDQQYVSFREEKLLSF